MWTVFVNTLSATVRLEISPNTTIGQIKKMICDSERMSADHFELSFRDQPINLLEMTADACGITQDCFITVLEKPINPVSFPFSSP